MTAKGKHGTVIHGRGKHKDGCASIEDLKLVAEHGIVSLAELPGRKRGKQEILARLPELTEMKEQLRRGLGVGEAAFLKLDSTKVASLNITTSRRIIKDLLKGFIDSEKLETKDGRKLDVFNYKADDGGEVIYVADAIELTRTPLPKRGPKKKGQPEKG